MRLLLQLSSKTSLKIARRRATIVQGAVDRLLRLAIYAGRGSSSATNGHRPKGRKNDNLVQLIPGFVASVVRRLI